MFSRPLHDSETYEQLRDTTRRFARNAIRPVADALDREERFPAEIYAEMAELGLFGIMAPQEHGGAGLDAFAYTIVMEELSRGYASVADQCGVVELIATLLWRYGTPEQRVRYLADVLPMRLRIAYCLTEAEAGSDLGTVKTTATKNGPGWKRNGSKLWIHNAPVADLGFVLARTDPAAKHRGLSIFIVDLHARGVTRGPKEHKMGQRASQIGGVTFDDVELGEDALLGELNPAASIS